MILEEYEKLQKRLQKKIKEEKESGKFYKEVKELANEGLLDYDEAENLYCNILMKEIGV